MPTSTASSMRRPSLPLLVYFLYLTMRHPLILQVLPPIAVKDIRISVYVRSGYVYASTPRLSSPVGQLLLASDGGAMTGLWLAGAEVFCRLHPSGNSEAADAGSAGFSARPQTGWMPILPERPLPALPPLAPAGSPFRQAVWKLLLEIPYGTDHHLRRPGPQSLRAAGHLCRAPGGGRRRGPQPHLHSHPLPPGGGHPWQPDRLCRRTGRTSNILLELEGADLARAVCSQAGNQRCNTPRPAFPQARPKQSTFRMRRPPEGAFHYRMMQISPPLPSLMMRVSVSCSFLPGILRHPLQLGLQIFVDQLVEAAAERCWTARFCWCPPQIPAADS